ncbi:AraC family transcriptional regulator [Rhizobium sp. BK650]|uniref:helix-turn-helix domain-containing protein n=1 Tax=Rhizobium sp. BK650 TaxID=2586990 RepID=UPI00162037B4|nr:AraC family transcriptional regulator [Rhizobium sp. BK650]MBB3659906.1 AraC family transcriptional regulator [Rhizobium sp. BK650]
MHAFPKNSSSAVSIVPRCDEAGTIRLPPIGEHRIVVHASSATWSVCMETGARHLRRAGDIDLVPAGETGGFVAEAICRSLEVRLPPNVLQRAADENGHVGRRASLHMRHVMRNERIVYLAQALEQERQAGGPAGAFYAEAVGLAIAAQLMDQVRMQAVNRVGLSERRLRRLVDFIEAHIDRTLTIATLAREAGASGSHLRQSFKLATGITLHRYVMQRRVERARLLLVETGMSASEAALSTGFSHQSHMARWMRRELGSTPRELRTNPSLGGR